MKTLLYVLSLLCLVASLALVTTACGTIKREFTSDGSPQSVPPITQQLRAVGGAAQQLAPGPTGDAVALVCGALGSVAAVVSGWAASRAKAHAAESKAHASYAAVSAQSAKTD